MQVFPGDDFTAEQIDAMLVELESQHLVGRFDADGECYLAVTGWHHQKIERPTYKYPAPPDELQFGEVSSNTRRHIAERSPPEGNGEDRSGEDRKGEDTETAARKRAVFVKPTIEQVREYCAERKNQVDPEAWLAYYEANGWRVGRNPMKDWRAAVVTWEKNGYSNGKQKPKVTIIPNETDEQRYARLEREWDERHGEVSS
jgi:hypothetical protein